MTLPQTQRQFFKRRKAGYLNITVTEQTQTMPKYGVSIRGKTPYHQTNESCLQILHVYNILSRHHQTFPQREVIVLPEDRIYLYYVQTETLKKRPVDPKRCRQSQHLDIRGTKSKNWKEIAEVIKENKIEALDFVATSENEEKYKALLPLEMYRASGMRSVWQARTGILRLLSTGQSPSWVVLGGCSFIPRAPPNNHRCHLFWI